MRCTSPRSVGFKSDGKTLAWSPKNYCKEYATFQLPCGKCIECRLDYARQWAVRCVHEAQMHPQNCFITLTYNEEHLNSKKLVYEDFQKFMKRLRKLTNNEVGMFVTGEYGPINKRPHWHAIIFNWEPKDQKYFRSNERGDRIYKSATTDKIWGKGHCEIGSVTFESAGYCARYSAKKLVHGKDEEHEFNPISKKSSKYAIGKKWLEEFWPDAFAYGRCILRDGTETGIPRYYEKWLKDNHPGPWLHYVTETKRRVIEKAEQRSYEELVEYSKVLDARKKIDPLRTSPLTRLQVKRIIQEQKFKMLQDYLKL